MQKSFVVSESCSELRCMRSRGASLTLSVCETEVLKKGKKKDKGAKDVNVSPNEHVDFDAKNFHEKIAAASKEHQRKASYYLKPKTTNHEFEATSHQP